MTIRMMAAVALVLIVPAAEAQMRGSSRTPDLGAPSKEEPKKPKVDEKAYHEALKRIPEPTEKYDPWGGARPAPNTKAK